MSIAVAKPAHVPDHLVYDFDFYALGGESDIHRAWLRLRDAPDIFWTPRNGGHWVATRGEDIQAIQLDHARFSHKRHYIPFNPEAFPAYPLHLDPPDQKPYRDLIASSFLPKHLRELEGAVTGIARELVARLAPQGRCEFVGDFAQHLPIIVILHLLDLPMEDREMLLGLADEVVRSGVVARRQAAQLAIRGYLESRINERRGKDGADLVSKVANATVNGRPITHQEALSVCGLLLVGGLDTVVSALSFIAHFLATHPEERRFLHENPDHHDGAVEELLRRFGIPNTARMITHDFTYRGIAFKAGEQIQVPVSMFGLDDRITPDPLTVDFDRPGRPHHVAFGSGPHTCPGNNLARREIKVFLREWLAVIPDFALDPDRPARFASGMTNTVTSLPLVWTLA